MSWPNRTGRDLSLFYMYFHGDDNIKASHQTGWNGVVARSMRLLAAQTPGQVLEGGTVAHFGA